MELSSVQGENVRNEITWHYKLRAAHEIDNIANDHDDTRTIEGIAHNTQKCARLIPDEETAMSKR